MKIRPLEIPDLFELTPQRHGDDRGFFCETWNRRKLLDGGIDTDFCAGQLVALGFRRHLARFALSAASARPGKASPCSNVSVDIRKGSPTFGRWATLEISRDKWNQIYVPPGFAHGFVSLVPDTEVAYKVSGYNSPEHDRAIRFDDPALVFAWPDNLKPFQLSAKDCTAPLLSEIDTGFVYP